MNNMKKISLFVTLFIAPALLLCAQTTAPKTSKPPLKKAAAKPAVKKAAPVPAAKPEPAAVSAPAADPLAESLEKIKSTDREERRKAADYIGQSRNPKGAPALMAALSDDAPRVRQSAADALGMLTWREASPKLSDMLINDGDAGVRQQAAISISYIMDQAAGPALVKALKDTAPSVRYAALHTLAVMKYSAAEGEMIGLLSSGDSNMRRGAISALGQLQSKKAAGPLAAAMKDSDQYVRLEAVKALGSIGDTSSAGELIKLLAPGENAQLRVEAAYSLAKMDMNDGLPVAYEYAKSADLSVRSQALNVLALAGDARTLQFIEELYTAEQDPAGKGMLDFTRQRLMLRIKTLQKK